MTCCIFRCMFTAEISQPRFHYSGFKFSKAARFLIVFYRYLVFIMALFIVRLCITVFLPYFYRTSFSIIYIFCYCTTAVTCTSYGKVCNVFLKITTVCPLALPLLVKNSFSFANTFSFS